MMIAWLLLIILLSQRLIELWIARKNEQWMKREGAIEYGQSHYIWLVVGQTMFILVWTYEAFQAPQLSPYWPIFMFLYSGVLFLRIWTMRSLGRYWNTKIIVLPGAPLQVKGPYRWMKHPNYVIVYLEMLLLAVIVEAYVAMVAGVILQSAALAIRIPTEEAALQNATTNQAAALYKNKKKFWPNLKKFQ
ncbi:hypothetical protein G4V62_01830 [Bacillaceae bacterium SIJ1]|uniref:isoprenylcysteine carboxyl methyltransferase family protein n=1 Tax=Litoribacterium kuwaitense TaxID=1398745 RepID=UPI0013EDE2DD|nr:isoprenylcysteine carboxylmethyltransferase family protein [Litoribacterium kuwaitense]NGP43763.1 hypothetical protein [Litoribacterium kuwaitense]